MTNRTTARLAGRAALVLVVLLVCGGQQEAQLPLPRGRLMMHPRLMHPRLMHPRLMHRRLMPWRTAIVAAMACAALATSGALAGCSSSADASSGQSITLYSGQHEQT